MTFSGSAAPPTVRIATVRNGLQPSEARVADLILQAPEVVVEATAQDVADRAEVARSTVIRTCQRLGYRSFPALRVALAAELAQQETVPDYGPGALGRIRTDISALAAALPRIVAVLDEAAVEEAVARIVGAGRVLVLANGLSSPLASDLAMRLTALGRSADFVADAIGQQIAARQLTAADACVIISGSGANETSLKVARAARAGGSHVVALTSFAASPLVDLAHTALVVALPSPTFRAELEHTSRVAHAVFIEAFVGAVGRAMGEDLGRVRQGVLEILSHNLGE